MDKIAHKSLQVNGLKLHVAEIGSESSPAVVFLHGFPEIWYSWRHQMIAVANAGFRAIAPDFRGYGLSDSPAEPKKASFADFVNDIASMLDSLAISKALKSGELKSGRGLNQERGLQRPADTRWSSHYDTLINLILQFSAIIDVLEYIAEDGLQSEQRAKANVLLGLVQSFDFIFNLHLMKHTLGITNELSKALQRKEQDIVNAMKSVQMAKERLQNMRGRSARKAKKVTNYHRYRVEVFCSVLDRQLQELNNRFTEASTRMLSFLACLSPENSFSTFHQESLIDLAR